MSMQSRATRLTEKYPNAYSDFYGSGTPCVYKSGPDWPVRRGPLAQRNLREPRPVHGHAIQHTWVSIGTRICDELESVGIMWTSVNPLAYANAGEPKPFCPLIIRVGVNPGSLLYETAVAAAAVVKNILVDAGFPDIEVAFIESVATRFKVAFIESVATRFTGPKLLSFNPLVDTVPDLRKPFTPVLGTAALYFRLSKDDDRVVVLTCAHVARPPPVYHNTGMTHKKGRQRPEEIVVLGTMGYDNTVTAMMATIGDRLQSIDAWNNVLRRLGDPVEGENENVTESCDEHLDLVAKATRVIQRVKAIHSEVTENYTTFDQRTIGFVLHSEKIEVSVEPYKFTKDWAFIELYNDKIDWTTFKALGGKLSISEYGNTMFPQPQDRKNYSYPESGLLQVNDFVREAEMRNPQQLDVHGEKCLLVVKNGLATGTTVGASTASSPLGAFTRTTVSVTSPLKLVSYPTTRRTASLPMLATRVRSSSTGGGRIVGILTGGSADITYLTPYWWVEEQVKAKFPGCFLYEVVQ
ncbi:hypothetical protein B0H21DRAFT_778635 [Amylocystis lapponica]|nr:hypothetical protein B0H21DRAFT_778635 [Amylocystis lapponica]